MREEADMQPIHPLDTHSDDEGVDFVDRYEPGSSWKPIATVVLVLALIVGAIVILGEFGPADGPTQQAPSEAPAVPGQ